MKIGWLSPSPLLPTGIGKVSQYLIRGLGKRGFEVCVANPQHGGRPLTIDGVTHYPLFDDFGLFRLFLEEVRPDVMVAYASNWYPPYTQVSQMCAERDIKLLWYAMVEFSDLSMGYLESLVGATMVATASRHGQAVLSRHIPLEKVLYVPHGVDRSFYKPMEPRPRFEGSEGRFIFGMIARNTLRKEYPVLLRAFSGLPERVKERSLLYLHTMPFEESAGRSGWGLPQLILKLGVGGRVLMPGEGASKWFGFPEDDMAKRMNCLDCHCLFSAGEGFGLPVLETMACGVPNIVSRHTSLPEVAGEGALYAECWEEDQYTAEGFQIASTRIASAREQMLRMFEDAELREELRQKALEQASKFTWESAVDAMTEAVLKTHACQDRLGREILRFDKPVLGEGFSPYWVKYIPEGKGKCLDIGSGLECHWRGAVEEKGYEYVSLDNRNGDKVMIRADAREIPLGDGSVELAFSHNVLEHIPTEDQVKMIREAKRVAKRLCFIFTLPEHPAYWLDPDHKPIDPKVKEQGKYIEDGGGGVLLWSKDGVNEAEVSRR
jgi:glycosyltransferase involved in cell wall biosynthesis